MPMNLVAEEMRAILEDGTELMHYGVKYRSGRYPWGSGEDPYQNSRDFLGRRKELLKEGFSYTDETGKTWTGDNAIAKSLGLSIREYRTEISLANDQRYVHDLARIKSLQADGLGSTEIGRKLGMKESTVRSMLDRETESATQAARKTADFIKNEIDKRGMIDVGKNVERELNVPRTQLDTALYILQKDGYELYSGGMDQINKGQRTIQKVICPPGTPHSAIYKLEDIHTLKEYITRDGGETYEKKFYYPASLDSKRVKVLTADEIGPDGEPGVAKDGIIQLRRGVPDLSLGESRYAQVRILVDDNKYLKGMAVYSDNMPDGIDVVFNSNKKTVDEAYKKIKTEDPDNPFGSAIKDIDQGGQYFYDPKTGKRVTASTPGAKLGVINKRADESDWSDWKDALPSQFLSKQSTTLAKKQLNLAKADKLDEYKALCELENPTVKKLLLKKFSDECDAAAVHLQAAALPGQKYHVIIPINSLKDNEIYAPNYKDGTELALVRYPHGGIFEIPKVIVNNKHAAAKKLLGTDVVDAVGINKNVAERLSGADFDGDTVMCIPTSSSVKIRNKEPLEDLIGFDTRAAYGPHTYEGRNVKLMKNTGTQMGIITNLITDMTLLGAPDAELARAVKHSMVVIDAEKHKLDYQKSYIDNGIAALHKKWQGHYDEEGKYHNKGSGTIVSRAKGQVDVPKRKGSPNINTPGKPWYDPSKPEGAYIYKDDPKATYNTTKVNKKTGEVITVPKTLTQKSTRMAEVDDAYDLVSATRHPMEIIYADYANSMKALANQARKELVSTGNLKYSPSAKAAYQNEVGSLMAKLNDAQKNSVRERAATRLMNIEVENNKKAYKEKNGTDMKEDDVKKMQQRAMTKYRAQVGSVSRKDRSVKITDREWEAIQAGAITENKLMAILNNADIKEVRQRAAPKTANSLSTSQIARAKNLAASGYTLAQIADKMGKSPSTISKVLKGAN
jgi:DNA-binding CsgD family transcriptional regulator